MALTRPRLILSEKTYVVKQMTLNKTYSQIKKNFKKRYGRNISDTSLVRIRRENMNAIVVGQQHIVETGATTAVSIKQKSYRLMEQRLDNAIEDETEISELRRKYRSGEISEGVYKESLKKYEQLTINELVKVSEAMHNQSKKDGDEPPVTPQDQAAFAALLAGIQSGNPVAIVQHFANGPGNPAA